MNRGQRRVPVRDSKDLPAAYGVTSPKPGGHMTEAALRRSLMTERQESCQLPHAEYIRLESAAVAIHDFDPGVFPGLLQTPDYVRAIHDGAHLQFSDQEIAERIEDRRNRQQLLYADQRPKLSVVVDEAVLHRAVGGPQVMAQQLGHVIKVSEQEGISVRVLPFAAGAHPAVDSTFTLLEFADSQPTVVYVEGLAGQFYLESLKDIERYEHVYSILDRIAMNESQSAELMADIMMKYRRVNSRA